MMESAYIEYGNPAHAGFASKGQKSYKLHLWIIKLHLKRPRIHGSCNLRCFSQTSVSLSQLFEAYVFSLPTSGLTLHLTPFLGEQ